MFHELSPYATCTLLKACHMNAALLLHATTANRNYRVRGQLAPVAKSIKAFHLKVTKLGSD